MDNIFLRACRSSGSEVGINVRKGQLYIMSIYIHPLADVQTDDIGDHSRIWQFVVILAEARIGMNANICSHCLIENDVVIGDRVTVKSGVQLWDGTRLGDDVFIGPNATFSNDRFPRSKKYPVSFPNIEIGCGASVGAGAVLLPGVFVGAGAMIGAGAVVTKAVPANAVVVGNPARVIRYVESDC